MLLVLVVNAVAAIHAQTERKVTVDDLFQLVESNSKTLLQQKTSVEFARKNVEAARSARLPDVNVSASAMMYGDVLLTDRDLTHFQGFALPRWGNSLAVEAQQVVYAGGAVDAGIRMAQLQCEQAGVDTEQVRQQQRFLAIGQFLDIVKLMNREQVVGQNIALTEQLLNDIRAKHEQGMVLQNDVTRYELQMQSLRLELRKLQDERSILNHQLCHQLGLQDVCIVPELPSETVSTEGMTEWGGRALASSPIMQQARISQQMAREQLQLAKSEMLPKVALFAADNFSGPFTYDIPPLDKNINIWYVGVGVKYPLSALFKQNKRVQQARIGLRRSVETHAVAEEQTDNAVQQAWTLWQQAYVELETCRKSVELARQNYQVVNDRYLSQLALVTDMVDASNMKLSAELGEVDAHIAILFAYYRMKYVSGTL